MITSSYHRLNGTRSSNPIITMTPHYYGNAKNLTPTNLAQLIASVRQPPLPNFMQIYKLELLGKI